jgi:hypothetical protein
MYIYTFLLRIADTVTSRNTDLSWDTLYISLRTNHATGPPPPPFVQWHRKYNLHLLRYVFIRVTRHLRTVFRWTLSLFIVQSGQNVKMRRIEEARRKVTMSGGVTPCSLIETNELPQVSTAPPTSGSKSKPSSLPHTTDATRSCETSANFYQTTRRHIPEYTSQVTVEGT